MESLWQREAKLVRRLDENLVRHIQTDQSDLLSVLAGWLKLEAYWFNVTLTKGSKMKSLQFCFLFLFQRANAVQS